MTEEDKEAEFIKRMGEFLDKVLWEDDPQDHLEDSDREFIWRLRQFMYVMDGDF